MNYVDDSKSMKKRLKRVKQKLEFATKAYVFIPQTTLTVLDGGTTATLVDITKSLAGLNFANELSFNRFNSSCEKLIQCLCTSSEDCISNYICEKDLLGHLITSILKIPTEEESHFLVLKEGVALLAKLLKNQKALRYFCDSSMLHSTKIVDLICRIIPFCTPNKPRSVENLVLIDLIDILSNCLAIGGDYRTAHLHIK